MEAENPINEYVSQFSPEEGTLAFIASIAMKFRRNAQ